MNLHILFASALLICLSIFTVGCGVSLPRNAGQPSIALPPAQTGVLAESVSEMMAQHPQLSGVTPLASGTDAFAARMLLADSATTSIDTQYYIWRADLTGYLLLARLHRAAERGVRVRLLLDDHGTGGLDAEIAALQAHPNAEVRLWNPFTVRRFKMLSYGVDFFRLNRRMHNKSFTVDGQVSVLGGRNIGDEYFNTGFMPLSVDLDVLVVGEVVPQISQDFDRYWNSVSAYPSAQIITKTAHVDPILAQLERFKNSEQMVKYRSMLEQSKFLARLGSGALDFEWTQVTLVSDDPAKGQGALPREKLLTGLMAKAVGEIEYKIDGVTPYFVPGKEGVTAFNGLVKNGVEVRILTNSLEATDVLPVHAGYAKRRKKLLEGGVELFEMRSRVEANEETKKLGPFGSSASSLHAKTFAVDGKRIFVGSFNFDPRSARLNTEMGVLIESERLAQGLHSVFDSGLSGAAWQVKLHDHDLLWMDPGKTDTPAITKEPGSNIWRNSAIKVIGWLPVEWLL